MKQRFGTLRPTARKTWVVMHVGFSVGWLGVSLTMLVLSAVGAFAEDRQLRRYAYEFMHVMDLAVVIPSALLTLVTGLVVSVGTKWGLVSYRWVLAKLAITLTVPLFAAFQQRFWLEDSLRLSRGDHVGTAASGIALWVCAVVFSLLLWTATALSTVKPWGRTRWAPSARGRTRFGPAGPRDRTERAR